MKKFLLTALLMAATSAFATTPPNPCGNHGNNCDPPTTPTNPSNHNEQNQTNGQSQGQSQGQGQAQGQTATGGASRSDATAVGTGYGGAGGTGGAGGHGGAGGDANVGDVQSSSAAQGGHSRSSATGGTSLSSSESGVSDSGNSASVSGATANGTNTSNNTNRLSNGSESNSGASANGTNTNQLSNGSTSTSNGVVSVDAADRSSTQYNNSTRVNTFIPGDLPSNAMTIAPGAHITVAGDTECGVLQQKVQVPVYQWNKRGTKKVQVGVDEDLAPVLDSNGVQIDYQTVYTGDGGYYLRGSHVTYVLSTQGSSNSSQLGLQGGGGGGYGGVSYGSGRSYSQAGAKMVIRSCIAERVPAPAVIQFAEPRVPRG